MEKDNPFSTLQYFNTVREVNDGRVITKAVLDSTIIRCAPCDRKDRILGFVIRPKKTGEMCKYWFGCGKCRTIILGISISASGIHYGFPHSNYSLYEASVHTVNVETKEI